jgi:hypothetical protein
MREPDGRASGVSLAKVAAVALLLVFASAANLSCAGARRVRYAKIIRPARIISLADPEEGFFAFSCSDSETHAVLSGVTFEIRSKAGVVELTSDDDGIVRIPVAEELERENPWVVCTRERRTSLNLHRTMSLPSTGPPRTRRERVTTQGKQSIAGNGFSVWFDPGLEDEAAKAATRMEEQRAVISRTIGIDPAPWGVILIETKQEDTTYVTQSPNPGISAWLYARGELNNGRFDATNTHEWTESTLNKALDLPSADPRNRFITDGLAEYVNFLATGRRPQLPKSLKELLDKRISSVNLLKNFQAVSPGEGETIEEALLRSGYPPGYALSFTFWHRLCREHGNDLPAKFLSRVKSAEKRDSANLIRILSDLTGEPNLKKRLTKADVQEALDLLESLPKSKSALRRSGQARERQSHGRWLYEEN